MSFSENFVNLVALKRTNLFRIFKSKTSKGASVRGGAAVGAGKECVCCEYTFAEAVPGLFTSEGAISNSVPGACIISNMCALETIDKGFSWHGGSKEMFDKCIAESMKLQPRTTLHDHF